MLLKSKNSLVRLFKHFKDWLSAWPETWAITLVMLPLIVLSYYILVVVFGLNEGVYSLSTFQGLLIGAFSVLLINILVFLGIKFNFPSLWEFYLKTFKHSWEKIPEEKQLIIFLAFYLAFFYIVGHIIVSAL